jgi:hypothetical protein
MTTCTLPLREALTDAISSGRFADTKIILYSRRDSSGTVSKPKVLYANSHVLKSVSYFSDREFLRIGFGVGLSSVGVFSGFAESEQKNLSEPIDEDETAEHYDYHSDSDLEDDEDAVNAGKILRRAISQKNNSVETGDKNISPPCGEWKEPSGKGKIIKIHDIAFITCIRLFERRFPRARF